jgi:quercetin dioxygenase-like cupin family protein
MTDVRFSGAVGDRVRSQAWASFQIHTGTTLESIYRQHRRTGLSSVFTKEITTMSKLKMLMIAFALFAPVVVVGARSSQAAPPGPTAPFEGHYPITVAAGDYDLVYLVPDFAPGAAIPLHFHGGPATVVGMDGVLTLRPEGAPEKTLRPGDVVNEKQGARHEMINTSSTPARILATVLLPHGADLTTILAPGASSPGPTVPFQGSYPITVAAGDYDLVNLVLDFAPGASIPLHFHGGPAVVVGMDGVLTLRPESAPEKTLQPGGVVNEKQGARHEMINTSSANARILAGVLLPKGIDLTTIVPVPAAAPTHPVDHTPMPGMPSTGAPTAADSLWWPLLLLGLLGVLTGLRLLAVHRARH